MLKVLRDNGRDHISLVYILFIQEPHRSFSFAAGLTSALSPSTGATTRDSIDPIAELLSQLSGVRRSAPSSSSSQLQQLQMQLERQQAQAQRLEQRAQAGAGTSR